MLNTWNRAGCRYRIYQRVWSIDAINNVGRKFSNKVEGNVVCQREERARGCCLMPVGVSLKGYLPPFDDTGKKHPGNQLGTFPLCTLTSAELHIMPEWFFSHLSTLSQFSLGGLLAWCPLRVYLLVAEKLSRVDQVSHLLYFPVYQSYLKLPEYFAGRFMIMLCIPTRIKNGMTKILPCTLPGKSIGG